jgi:dTDP-4-dehydrorhamnose reductase
MGVISATTETNVDLIANRNIRATLDLLEWCTDAQVPFIFTSSAATYSDGAQGFDDSFARDSLAKRRPLNPYGRSKHVVDRRLARLVEAGAKLPPQWIGLKFFNVYGPNEYHKGSMQSVVAKNYSLVRDGQPLRLASQQASAHIDRVREMDRLRKTEGRLPIAAELMERKARETVTYYAFPSNRWRQLRTINPLGRKIREIKRRTRVVGAFPRWSLSADTGRRKATAHRPNQVGRAAVHGNGDAPEASDPRGSCRTIRRSHRQLMYGRRCVALSYPV